MIPARAQSLHGSFLGSEARGIAFEAVGLWSRSSGSLRGVNALQKALAEALDGLADARNFRDVDACAYDHECYLPRMESLQHRIL